MHDTLARQQLKFDFDNSLLSTRIEVQEQSFETVSRDIHDGIGQVMSLGCVQLASIKGTIDNPAIVARLEETLSLFKQTVRNLRLLSHSLNTGLVERRSLEQSVRTEFDRIEAFTNIKCSYEQVLNEESVSPEERLIIFRIIQEALQNTLKYAEASSIDIRINKQGPFLMVRIRDDGIGFDTNDIDRTESLGLLSMKQRAALLDARLEITSAQGKGTTVTLSLPVNSIHEKRDFINTRSNR